MTRLALALASIDILARARERRNASALFSGTRPTRRKRARRSYVDPEHTFGSAISWNAPKPHREK
jgi:hypothetical protein